MTRTQPIGDAVPASLTRYYEALDDFRVDDAVAAFTEDTRYAAPLPGVAETAPRTETVGRQALATRFEQRGPQPWRHDVLLCVVDGSDCLVEGVSRAPDGVAASTFAASALLDDAGLVSRYLAYATAPAVIPAPGDVRTQERDAADAVAVLERYFTALDRGAFAEAADCFSDDVVYSHPPYLHTGIDSDQRVEFSGRRALCERFEARGAQSFDHRLVACIQRGPHCLVEGLVEGLPGGASGSFLSSFTLGTDGLIARYLSFYCEPSVPR